MKFFLYNIFMSKIHEIKNKFSKISDFLFPNHSCICCRKENDSDSPYRICSRCFDKIPFTKDKFCLKCGEIINGDYDFCITCKNKTYNFDYARSVMAYNKTTAPIIMKFKYNGLKSFGLPLAHLLKDFYESSDLIANTVTFVPMPEEREKERGYNQSKVLCEHFSFLTNIPMIDSLYRTRSLPKQSTLNSDDRAKNIKGSFKAINKHEIRGKEILLIDDVMTTGATASECAKVLLSAGAKNVQVLTLCKTPALEVLKMSGEK